MSKTHSTLTHLQCSRCGVDHDADRPATVCDACAGVLLPRYDLTRASETLSRRMRGRARSMWRYEEVMPVRDRSNIVDLGEGLTELRPLRRIGDALGFPYLLGKDESLNPTGSFKARGMSAAVSRMKELGLTKGVTPTAGNAGLAFAAYAAAAGIEAHVFVPRDAPRAFVQSYRLHGAQVVEVDGTIADAGRAAREGIAEHGWFDVSTLKEPYRVEGKKTMGYELWESLDRLPDAIVYPTGGGTGLIGMWKAFEELEAMGLCSDRRPRMIAVQAEGCAPVVKGFEAGAETTEPWPDAHTFASGLRVPSPYAGREVLECVRASGGTAIAISDDQIMDATLRLARDEGLGIAPEAAATIAALPALVERGALAPDERVVVFLTGGAATYLDVIDVDRRGESGAVRGQ